MATRKANEKSANSKQRGATTTRSMRQASEASEDNLSPVPGNSQDLEALSVKKMMSNMLATSKKRRERRRVKLEEQHTERVTRMRDDILKRFQSLKAKSDLGRRQQVQRLLQLVKRRQCLEHDIAVNVTILQTARRECVSSFRAVLAARTEGLSRLSKTG